MYLLRVFLGCIILASQLGSSSTSNSGTRNRNKLFLSTHSNFLRSAYSYDSYTGRTTTTSAYRHEIHCRNNASVCSDPVRNPKGGVCCFNSLCKQIMSDESNCGGCSKACGYGLSCCKGSCVNLMTDPLHCGVCDVRCQRNVLCEFGLCGYAAAAGQEDSTPPAALGKPRFPKQW